MSDEKPLVSIGMTVYNGERFIRQALDSLLAQDYENFELIISDNASTDRTKEICQEYAAKDRRIRYHRNEINLGAIKNAWYVFNSSEGKYFMFAADHDLWHPAFISRCVSNLEEDPRAVLAYSRTMLIDTENKSIKIISNKINDNTDLSLTQRYKYLTSNLGWCDMIYGMIRKETFARIDWTSIILSLDRFQLMQLALRGAFAQADETLFYMRKIRPDENHEEAKKRWLYALDPASADKNNKHSNYYFRFIYYYALIKMIIFFDMRILEKLDLISYTLVDFVSFTVAFFKLPMAGRAGRMLKRLGLLRRNINSNWW